ncbi:hypothetical protein BG57_30545 [Caballeronia grimmiae]|uniref:Uncharacterized protein n=1 Tax=Caballeronia grimmiae TaxID=1071679 RepID=A0A069NAL5_9BURK|nr:hypothetical protein BG57_30545 [Caballeronia grimmiae]
MHAKPTAISTARCSTIAARWIWNAGVSTLTLRSDSCVMRRAMRTARSSISAARCGSRRAMRTRCVIGDACAPLRAISMAR